MPRTHLTNYYKGPDFAWFGGFVGAHLRLAGINQAQLPGCSEPTWRKYIKEPEKMDFGHFVILMNTLQVSQDERKEVLDYLLQDIDKNYRKGKGERK